jgi:hypothetical protein
MCTFVEFEEKFWGKVLMIILERFARLRITRARYWSRQRITTKVENNVILSRMFKQDPQHHSQDMVAYLSTFGYVSIKYIIIIIYLLFNENCAFLCYYVGNSGNFLPTFWYNLSVPSSSVDNWRRNPSVAIRGSCGNRVGNDINVAQITGITTVLDTYW